MAGVNRFEDMDCWKESRKLVKVIYSLTQGKGFSNDWGLKDQIQRAAISVMSNIAEGFESQTNKEFVQFLYHAKRSPGEVRSQLYAASDLGYITEQELSETGQQAMRVSRMTASLISYLKSTSPQKSKV